MAEVKDRKRRLGAKLYRKAFEYEYDANRFRESDPWLADSLEMLARSCTSIAQRIARENYETTLDESDDPDAFSDLDQ